MRRPRLAFLLPLVLLFPSRSRAEPPPHGLRVPPGFEVTEFAGSDLANDLYCLTLGPRGEVVVSGRGFVRLLADTDGDGRADRALDFAGAPKDGAMGLFWEGDTLWCVGDGGLRRYRDAGGAGRLRPPELVFPLKTGGEHAAHAVRRGPDGWLYLLCGNNTGIRKSHAALPTSPIKDPIAGCVLRLPPDLKGSEIVADGFRNAYGMDFNADGELFTFDSDNERCVSLPWYEPTRCYHVVPGGHHGWRNPQLSQTWRLPPYFLDVVPPVATLGRGSPTGVVCYRHTQFPAHYRGGLFLLDWTFGRIYFVQMERRGSSYAGRAEVFLQAVGDNGFAPTAAAVHPQTGDLYVSIGGRGTRGAVYRIRYPAGLSGASAAPGPTPRSLEWRPGTRADSVRRATGADLAERRRALADIWRHREHFRAEQIEQVIRANACEQDRLLRQATAALLTALPVAEQDRLAGLLRGPAAATAVALARPRVDVARLLGEKDVSPELRLDAARLVQLALGGLTAPKASGTVWEGYTRRPPEPALPADAQALLRSSFPSGHADLDRELSRTLAMIEDDDSATLRKVADRLTAGSDPIEDLHYLIVLARLRGPRSAAITHRAAEALLALDGKVVRRHLNRDTNWPLRVAELHAGLAEKDPALNAALLAHAEFGRPDHALFTRCPGFDRRRAAEVFLARAAKDKDFAWNSELIGLLGALPAERTLPLLRRLWGERGLDEAILPLLARRPAEEDRARFLTGLGSARVEVVRAALGALEKLPRRAADRVRDRDEVVALVLALRRLPEGKEQDALRGRFDAYLQALIGQKLHGAEAWAAWCVRAYPERAARLADPDGVDVGAWEKRLAALDWSAGDAARGEAVFAKASCASCHSGAQAVGPDLRGVTGRFSRADLFTAILRPSKDVPPRYRTTAVTTSDGKLYQGLIVYEAADGLILQTGPAATVRLDNGRVAERRLTATSLMPAGLLDRLSDREIADLYAYLKSLGAAAKK
jgi:putative heme-binding domain-containing protein